MSSKILSAGKLLTVLILAAALGYAELVAAQSRALGALSREIASEISAALKTI